MTKAQRYAQQEQATQTWLSNLHIGAQVTCKCKSLGGQNPYRNATIKLTGEIVNQTNDAWEISLGLSETVLFTKKQGLPVVRSQHYLLGRLNEN